MRITIGAIALGAVLLLAACSYKTEFVVINESDQSINIRYKVKDFPGPFAPPVTPATIVASQLNMHGDQQWEVLTPAQYQIDQENRTITVRLMPHEALRVASMHKYGGHNNLRDAEHFPIEEIVIMGSADELVLKGQQALETFSNLSKALYTLTYKRNL